MDINFKKYYLILGGFIGFLFTFILGVFTAKEPLTNMLHASFGCIVGAVLMQILLFVIYLHGSREEENTKQKPQSIDNKKV